MHGLFMNKLVLPLTCPTKLQAFGMNWRLKIEMSSFATPHHQQQLLAILSIEVQKAYFYTDFCRATLPASFAVAYTMDDRTHHQEHKHTKNTNTISRRKNQSQESLVCWRNQCHTLQSSRDPLKDSFVQVCSSYILPWLVWVA
jgi:hypothetical protein